MSYVFRPAAEFIMPHFDDILRPEALNTRLSVNSKQQLFQRLFQIAAAAYGLDEQMVSERLLERERLGSTGFGGGVAIPQPKLDDLASMCAVVVVGEEAIPGHGAVGFPVGAVVGVASDSDSGWDN